jgi:phosphinothricin acetyltransferase
MKIRPARDEDFDVLTAITNRVIETSAIHFAYEPLAAGELRRAYSDRYPWFVVELDGGVAGYAKAGVWRERAAYAWTCETGIYLAEAARGRGVGRALYTVLLDEVARRGFRSVVAGVTLPNPASVALHVRLGFESVGVVRDAGWKLGAWHAVEFFQKRFATHCVGPNTAVS